MGDEIVEGTEEGQTRRRRRRSGAPYEYQRLLRWKRFLGEECTRNVPLLACLHSLGGDLERDVWRRDRDQERVLYFV